MKYMYITIAVVISLCSSCDKDFEEININPVLPNTLDPVYLFSNAQLTAVISTQFYQSQIVQQINTPYTGVLVGGNHNVVFDPNILLNFNSLYNGPVRFLTDVIAMTEGDENRSNLYHMARIWRTYVFQVLVDTYGDVPYTEAGKAFLDGITQPRYDDQRLIYDDLIRECTEATLALDAERPIEAQDLFYQGDIAQWRRLGNSLLLRLGMRYTKFDEGIAQEVVTRATNPSNGGLMSSNTDNAVIDYNNIFPNPLGNWLQGTERGNVYLGEPFVSFLKDTNDPRLRFIAVKYEIPANPLATAGNENTNPDDQQGQPYGYNENTLSTAPGYPGRTGSAFLYSQINRRTLGRIDAPEFLITYAQTQLLLAEAAVRGWYNADPAELYRNAVRGHMQQLSRYDASVMISEEAQTAYLAANPFELGSALQQINTQYWVASFLNGAEAWANFRRSGFPDLAPNPYPFADPAVIGSFIRRLVYPVREKSVNTNNVNEAISRMGADNLAVRLFWDVE